MQCIKCGAQNVNHASFCSACGNPFSFSEVASTQGVYKSHAGFWKRVGAAIIDSMILSLVSGVCMTVIMVVLGGAMLASASGITELGAVSYGFTMVFVIVIFSSVYFTLMESSAKQATLGKMALGIVVTDDTGKRISLARANARYWSKILSAMFLCIGYMMAGFTAKKQALHDLIASTLVVEN